MTVLVGLGIALGVPLPLLAAAGMAGFMPLPAAAGLLLAVARQLRRSARQGPSRDVAVLVGIAADLRAGASLRRAIADGAAQSPPLAAAGRLAVAGRSLEEIAAAMEDGLRGHGPIVGAAIRIAGRMGGEAAPVFEELAAQVIDVDEVRRERRVAMAPALAQAAVVGGMPTMMLAWMAASGRMVDLVAAGPASAGLMLVGAGLTAAGILSVGMMVWRAAR